jgi:hypothetical protein
LGANGDRCEGEWKDGKMNGQGVYYWHQGRRYEGEFLNGLSHGFGTLYLKDGSVATTDKGKPKSGLWKNDEFVGDN